MKKKPDGSTPSAQVSLREFFYFSTIAMLAIGLVLTAMRLRDARVSLDKLRRQFGYLAPSGSDQIAAAKVPADDALTYQTRVRIPETPRYRVCYSTLWPKNAANPEWFAAVDLPPGESIITVKVRVDPRDSKWKVTTIVQNERGTKRVATTLPEVQVPIFRSPNDAVSAGIGKETVIAEKNESIRLVDERWLVGEAGVMLYGDRPPDQDQIGVFAELQLDSGPI